MKKTSEGTSEFKGTGQASRNQNGSRVISAFRDLKTGTKLTCAFLAVAAIILIVAALGHFSLRSLNGNLVTLYNDRMVCVEQLGNAQSAFLRMRGDVYKYFLVPEQRAELRRIIAADIVTVNNNIKGYKATYLVQAEKDEIPKFDSAWAGYQQVLADFIKQVNAGEEKTAIQNLRNGVLYIRRVALEASLQNLINIQVDIGAQVKKDSDRWFAWSNVIMTVASILGVLFAIALGTLLGLSITRPLARIAGVARSVSGGDLDAGSLAGIASQRDEIGILAGAFTLMTGRLKETMEGLRHLNRELQASEEKYRIVADYTYDWETWIGLDHQFIYVSPSCKLITGYTANEFINDSSLYGRIVHPDDREIFEKHLAEIHVESGQDSRVEFRIITRNGEERWIEHLCGNIFGSDGKWLGQRSNNRDITDRKRMEEEIHKLNQELEQRVRERTFQLEAANKELEAFSYSVSHDLRAPLRGIDGFSLALLEDYHDKIDEQGKKYLQRIRFAAQHMAQLIDDMLNLSRVSRGEMNIQEVNLSKIAKEVISELIENKPEREVEFIIQEGIEARCDSHLLRIVLENLFGNAWKFTSNHPTARIEFGMQLQKDTAVYFVRDDGAGFDMKYAQKLFGAFQRLHTANEFPGTGIGLATVQRVIHRHGGKVWAEAQIDKGAAIYFTLK